VIDSNPSMRQWRFSMRNLLVGVAVFAAALFVIIRFVENLVTSLEIRQAHQYENEILGDLAIITAALRTKLFDAMPPPVYLDDQGTPLYSWRPELLCTWTGDGRLDITKPWNAPTNRSFAASVNQGLGCANHSGARSQETSLFAISGPDTAFDATKKVRASDLTAELILVMEVVNSGVHWMQPGDYDVQKLVACQGKLRDCVKPLIRDRVHVLFADGEVWAISGDAPFERVKPFFTITGARAHSRDRELGEFRLEKWKVFEVVSRTVSE
jgi:hypothetical protein